MLTFSEMFLNIVMNADGHPGNKGYKPISGGTHEIKAFKIVDARGVNKESMAVGQSNVPFSHQLGRKADTVTISGKWEVSEIPSVISACGYRVVPTMANIFLPGSVLTVTNNDQTWELPQGSNWLVKNFKYNRSVASRNLIIYEVQLIRWYEELNP